MKKFLHVSFILFNLCYPIFSMDEIPLEEYRARNVYEKVDTSAFPPLQSTEDCYQLGLSLIQSEINFWQDTQRNFLDENQRLRIIVNLLIPPPSLDQKGKPSLSNFKEKIDNLKLRTQILINPNDPSDTTNQDLFNMYKSYSTIIKNLESILDAYKYCKYSDNISTFQDQSKFLRQLKLVLLNKSKEIERSNLLARGLIQNSTIGMSVSKICYSQKGQLRKELPDVLGKYAFCDVEYVTQLFMPVIAHLFDTTQETLEKAHQAQQPKVVSGSRKKKKEPENKINTSRKPIVPTQSVTTPVTQVINQEPVLVIEAFSDVSASKTQQALEKKNSVTILEEVPDQSIPNALASENVDTQPSGSSLETNITPEIDTVSDILPLREAGSEATYDMRPWEAYQNKESTEKKQQNLQLPITLSLAPTFMLNEEYSFTARILLGFENASQNNVTMSAYEQLITKGLQGSVFNRKKCVYFMARSILTGIWCSVAMHRLHQDDPHIIPHGTRYWKIARQLLEDVGLDKSNL